MNIEAIRLGPGDDLRENLECAVRERESAAAFILSAVGSLRRIRLRYAGRNEAAAIEGTVDIVSLSGTLSPEGCHLHAAVAAADGTVLGGHVLPGCIVRTTADLVVGSSDAYRFSRALDPATGFRELVIRRAAGPA